MATTTCVLKQGDEYSIPIQLKINGTLIEQKHLALLDEVEFALGKLAPVSLDPAESYSTLLKAFTLPVTQEQTFTLLEGRTTLDIRLRWKDGNVIGLRKKLKVKVIDATSEEVLQ